MKRIARLLAGLGVVAGCQRGTGATAPPSELYRQDITHLCGAMVESGAAQLPAGDRAFAIATWLSAHLETQDARDYLVRIAPLTGEPKAAALDAEARRVGLGSCALAAEWRADDPGR